jgi:hypothetical protein
MVPSIAKDPFVKIQKKNWKEKSAGLWGYTKLALSFE